MDPDALRPHLAAWIQEDLLGPRLDRISGELLRALAGNFLDASPDWTASDEVLRAALRKEHASLLRQRTQHLRETGRELAPSSADYALRIEALSRQADCPILAGGTSLHRNAVPAYPGDEWEVRNSAIWFDRDWRSGATYSKMHCVPFSEYVPFKYSWPAFHRLLRVFVPSQMSQLAPGRTPLRFSLERPGGRWDIVTPICYEGTFARVCRELVRTGPKDRLIMLNLSNDGWFVWKGADGVPQQSTEHPQHLVSSVFRAIENRVPVVRVVNTGISASISSNGENLAILKDVYGQTLIRGTLALDGARDGQGGYLPGHGPKVLVDARVSMYSRVGDAFAMIVSLAAAGLAAYLVCRKASQRRRGTD